MKCHMFPQKANIYLTSKYMETKLFNCLNFTDIHDDVYIQDLFSFYWYFICM